MTFERLPYDEASTPGEMASDCAAVGAALDLPAPAPAPTQPPRQRVAAPFNVTDETAIFADSLLD